MKRKDWLPIAIGAVIILGLLLFALFVAIIFPVDIKDNLGPSLGPHGALNLTPGAPVVIVEYSDFQCPYCKEAIPTVKRVKAAYGDKVVIVYKHFPLASIHPFAVRAAEASECAGDQGKFWQYHDMLFENQGDFEDEGLISYAKDIGLDVEMFKGCLASGSKKTVIQQDMQEGLDAGLQGTPTFFINGRRLEGNQPFSAFQSMIDEELNATG